MLGKLAHIFFWPIIFLICVIASALYHLDSDLGRSLGRRLLNDYVTSQMAGRLEISRFETLRLWNAVAHDVTVYDPQGNVVVHADRVQLVIDPIAGLQGKLRFARSHLYGGVVTLIDDEVGQPTFIDAFGARDKSTGPSSDPLHALVEDMRLHDLLVQGDLLGIRGLRIENVEAHGRMDIHRVLEIRAWSMTGTVTKPFNFSVKIEKLSSAIFDDVRGSTLFAQLRNGNEVAKLDLTYAPPPGHDVTDPYDLNVIVGTQRLEATTLQSLGFEWAKTFQGYVAGNVRFLDNESGTVIEGSLSPEHGHAHITGKLKPTGYSKLVVQGEDLALSEILVLAPEAVVSGRIAFDIPEDDKKPTLMQINVEPFSYGPLKAGSTSAKVSWYPDYLNIDQGRMHYHGGDLRFEGRVGPGDQVRVALRGAIPHMETDPQLHAILPDFGGTLALDVRLSSISPGTLDLQGHASFDRFNADIASAKNVRVEGRINGLPKNPTIDAKISGNSLRVVGYLIGDGGIDLKGVPGAYEAHAFFSSGEHRKASFDADITSKGTTYSGVVSNLQIASDNVVWSGSIEEITFDPARLFRIKDFHMQHNDESLQMDGSWSSKDVDQFSLILSNMDLSTLKTLYPDSDFPSEGHADTTVELSGDFEKSIKIRAEGTLRDARWHDLFPLNAGYVIELSEGMLTADAQMDVAGKGTLTGTLQGMLGTRSLPSVAQLRNGYYQANLFAQSLDLKTFVPYVVTTESSVDGHADFNFTMAGTIDAPAFNLKAFLPDLVVDEWQPVVVDLKVDYLQGVWNTHLNTRDLHGPLLEVEGNAVLDVQQLRRNPKQAFSSLETLPWRAAIKMQPRLLGTLPLPKNRHVPPTLAPARVGGSLTASGGALKTKVDLLASVDWFGEIDDELCATHSRPRLTISAALNADKTTFQVDGLLDSRRVFTISGSALTPVARWLNEGKVPDFPVTDLKLDLDNAKTENIPFLCHYLAGPLQAKLEAKGLFSKSPSATLDVQSNALKARRVEASVRPGVVGRIFETPPSKLTMQMRATDTKLNGHSEVRWWNGGSSLMDFDLPVIWHENKLMPTLNPRGNVHASAIFDRTPLQAPLAWMAGTANVEGLLGGNIELRGTVEKPESVGRIAMQDGRIDLQTVGQRLRDVHAELILDEDGIVLRDAAARDAGGTLNAEGEFFLKNLRPNAFQLRLRSSQFPVRREGSPVAYLDSRMTIGGKFEGEKLIGSLQVHDLNVVVASTAGNPQDLKAHPEVRFADQPSAAEQKKALRPVEFNIQQTPKFWVKSNKLAKDNFAAQASAKLRIVVVNDVPSINGNVQLYQGYFEVLGKRFEVQSGSMNFTGGAELNPEVDLVAVHYLGGRTSDTVTLTVSGNLDDPIVEFSSSIPTDSESEVIALLLTGRRTRDRGSIGSQEAAGDDAANFLAGVAGGVFASTLRGELGNYAPTFGVETDETRAQTRVQVGFNVDSILPESWKSFITGLYVEGSFVTRRNEDVSDSELTGQAQRPGFLLEAQMRKGFVSTVTFSPPANWSIDFTWEP